MITFGIDPGISGAVAWLDHHGTMRVIDLPSMPIPGIGEKAMVRTKIDARALAAHVRGVTPAGEVARVVIEAVGVMGGKNNAVQTQGALLRSLGAIEAVMECLRLPITYVAPQTWKGLYGLIDPKLSPTERKEAARQKALRLWPAHSALTRKRDHNRAEAALLANYLVRTTE